MPQKPYRRTVEGILLHELLASYGRYLPSQGEHRFRPRRTLLQLLNEWRIANERNPRITSGAIAGQVAIEDILRAFQYASQYIHSSSRPSKSEESARFHPAPDAGSELWLRDPMSKLCGRADYADATRIIETKTGEKKPAHADQLLFYGALFLAATGRAPEKLLLIYTRDATTTEVPVPSTSALQDLLSRSRERVLDVERSLAQNSLPARPDPQKCSTCHVRALCDEYWSAKDSFDVGASADVELLDYERSSSATVESTPLGIYVRDIINLKTASIYLPIPQVSTFARFRILSLRSRPEMTGIRLTPTHVTEFYILQGGNSRGEPD